MTTLPRPEVSPRDRIVERSRRVVGGYLAARELWNSVSSLSALLRQMQREYEGRFLYELIQNAYDAQPTDGDGDIVVLLDLDEGDHGVLYVANTGMPFTQKNFEAICDLAQSDKAPDVSIGNKGVGFKSVIQVCQWPEIYSAAVVGQPRFEGYCFTFARPEEYHDLADGDAELAIKMQSDVAPYFLPVPLDDQPPHVLDFAGRGFATVIRLPIKSVPAQGVVIERVSRLADEDVPIHLFLERLRGLEITRLGDASGARTTLLRRDSVLVANPAGDADQRYELVELRRTTLLRRDSVLVADPAGDADQRHELVEHREQGQWFITSRRVTAKVMHHAIAASIAEGQLDESWASWSHDAWVSVAVRSDGLEIRPRLYTFLPMEREAAAPLHGHVHAPFSTKLARTSVNEQVVLNSLLLDYAAHATTAAVLAFREDESVLSEVALVDLVAWDEQHYDRVTQSFADAQTEMEHVEVVPIEPLADGRRRAAFSRTYIWPYSGLTILNQARLARDAGAELVSAAIADQRLERLESYCRNFFEIGFQPGAASRARWTEAAAKALHARRASPRTWDRFYADLAQVFEYDADALRAREILLGDDGNLYPPPPEEGGKDYPLVFFPPAYERTDEDDEVEGDVDLKPPATLRRALILMSEDLTWTQRAGPVRRRTLARKFLEDNRLVRRFKTVDLLEHIGQALAGSRRADMSRDALRFTFSLYVATRSVRPRDLRALRLRVPTRSGWRPAVEAFFSPGWGTSLALQLADLVDRGSTLSSEIAAIGDLLLKEPSDWPITIDDHAIWRAFLTDIGVRDGLWPRAVAHGTDSADGAELQPHMLARRFGLAPADAAQWATAVTAAAGWQPNHPNTPYRPRQAVSVIPGQADFTRLDDPSRALFAVLVVAGLGSWPAGALEITWYRFRHPRQPDERRWPSPITVFLRDAEWLPVSNPIQRFSESFVTPGGAWYFTDSRVEELPFFSPLVAGYVRRRLSADSKALSRLKELGLGDWGDVRDAAWLLHHLAGLIENDVLPGTAIHAFRRAYEAAWSRAAHMEMTDFLEEADDLPVVVACAGQLAIRRPSDGSDVPLYLMGRRGSLAERVLEASELPIVSIDRKDETRVRPLLEELFPERLVTADELDIEVITDAGSFTPDGSGELLLEGDRRWLDTLIALILETRRSGPGRLPSRRRREIGDRLRRVRQVNTSFLELRIADGQAVDLPESHRSVVPLDDEHHPTLIVSSQSADHRHGLEDLIAMARPLCELLGITQQADLFLLALERLNTPLCPIPTNADFARVLDIDLSRVAEVRSHLASSLDKMLYFLIPVVAYYSEASQALSLYEAQGTIATEEELHAAIARSGPSIPRLAQALAASREAESLSSMRDTLGLDYKRFNDALRALEPEYEPILNRQGHAHAMTHYVQINRTRLLQELRRRYLEDFRQGKSLDAYIVARELDISPDPQWLEAYDLPTDDMLENRIIAWLASHGDHGDTAAALPDIDLARTQNQALMARTVDIASRLIPAWARKNKAPLASIWAEDAPSEKLLSIAREDGFLDFELLGEDQVVAWLRRNGMWPEAMPRTFVANDLGLEEADLESEADVQERERRERLRRRRVLLVDDVEFSAESKDYPAIFDHVRRTIRDDVLAPSRPARLRDMPDTKVSGSGGGGGPASSRSRIEAMSDIQKAALGLVGETIAYAWLQHRYPDVCSPASWVSSYRETIGEPPGDNSLGYDFKISLKQTTLYFEVKATKGTDMRFDLGESEVSKAADCARTRRDDYRIIFITQALNAGARELHVLRNPLDPRNQRFYRFPGAGLTCTFRLAD
jgi:hypothetical protein